MDTNLYERVKSLDRGVKDGLIDALLVPVVTKTDIPFFMERREGRHYVKGTMVDDYVMEYFRRKGVILSNADGSRLEPSTIENAFNKPPIASIGAGVANFEEAPAELQKMLTGWENIYLLAGVWRQKFTASVPKIDYFGHSTIAEIVCDLLDNGLTELHEVHQRASLVTGGKRGPYVTNPKPAKELMQSVAYARHLSESDFNQFFNDIVDSLTRAIQLAGKVKQNGLFAAQTQSHYDLQRAQMQKIVDAHPFAPEFIQKIEAIPVYQSIKQHLKPLK